MRTQLSLLDRLWLDDAIPRVVEFARGRSVFSSDDLRGVITEPFEKNWHGILLAKMRNAGLIEQVGYKTSERKEANGRAVRTWRLK